jgi:hypothetical protein
MKDKDHMIISIDEEKHLTKFNNTHDESPEEISNRNRIPKPNIRNLC